MREVLNKLLFQRFSSSYGWIMTFLQNSVLKKIQHFVSVIIFKSFQLISLSAALVSFSKFHVSYPYKKCQEFHHFSQKIKKEI